MSAAGQGEHEGSGGGSARQTLGCPHGREEAARPSCKTKGAFRVMPAQHAWRRVARRQYVWHVSGGSNIRRVEIRVGVPRRLVCTRPDGASAGIGMVVVSGWARPNSRRALPQLLTRVRAVVRRGRPDVWVAARNVWVVRALGSEQRARRRGGDAAAASAAQAACSASPAQLGATRENKLRQLCDTPCIPLFSQIWTVEGRRWVCSKCNPTAGAACRRAPGADAAGRRAGLAVLWGLFQRHGHTAGGWKAAGGRVAAAPAR